jgi:general secretion pathway protein H
MHAVATRGFTLIELLVVVALIAVGSGVAVLALRDPDASALDREAVRLAALLESARAEARATGVSARFELRTDQNARSFGTDGGAPATPFRFVGLHDAARLPARWLEPGVSAEVVGAPAVVLGPEPILPPQRIALRLGDHRVIVASDGLGPFEPAQADAAPVR